MSPVFAHGQLRLYLLALLNEGPRHGYEVIQDLEQRFNGLYTPSAGTVYPRLAKLEEEGLVERSDEGRKAVYRITEAGRAEVRQRADELASLETDLDHSVRELAEQVRSRVSHQSSDLRSELREAARQARSTATPVGSADTWRGSPPGVRQEVESAVAQLREEARRAWRQYGLTSDQGREVVDILAEASRKIQDVVRGR
jgi:DNA-binding PadR family transcriptional regulator